MGCTDGSAAALAPCFTRVQVPQAEATWHSSEAPHDGACAASCVLKLRLTVSTSLPEEFSTVYALLQLWEGEGGPLAGPGGIRPWLGLPRQPAGIKAAGWCERKGLIPDAYHGTEIEKHSTPDDAHQLWSPQLQQAAIHCSIWHCCVNTAMGVLKTQGGTQALILDGLNEPATHA
jgi:hypothetical protein